MTVPLLIPAEMDARLTRGVKRLPEHMRDSVLNYVRHGIPPGHFLTAVLSNDLFEAVDRADDINIRVLADYVRVFYNDCPSACWGSPNNVKAWIERGMNARREAVSS
jgi:hypothetical protein